MSKKVTVKVAPGGKITVEAEGFVGESCVGTTQPLEEALGLDDGERELKPEYHDRDEALEIAG